MFEQRDTIWCMCLAPKTQKQDFIQPVQMSQSSRAGTKCANAKMKRVSRLGSSRDRLVQLLCQKLRIRTSETCSSHALDQSDQAQLKIGY